MSKRKNDFKFAVGSPDRLYSEIWSVKIRHSDVYICNRHGKDHKISLHESGICHSAVTREASGRFGLTAQQRRAVEWTVDTAHSGWADAFTLLLPYELLRPQPPDAPVPPQLLCIPCPDTPLAVAVKFLKTRADVGALTFEAPYPIHLLRSVRLASGECLTAVYFYTAEFNSVIGSANNRLRDLTRKLPLSEGAKLSGGFVSVSDAAGHYYHIGYRLDAP